MSRAPWEPTVGDIIRLHLYVFNRWTYDCPVCSHALHDGPCTRTVFVEAKGILAL